MTQAWKVTTEKERANFISFIGQLNLEGDGYSFSWRKHHHKRNLDQNALLYEFYNIASRDTGEPIADVRNLMKLRYGVPILRSEEASFRDKYDQLIKLRFTYEEKLTLMDWFPVSSLMNKKQMTRFIEDIVKHYAQLGIVLKSINEPPLG